MWSVPIKFLANDILLLFSGDLGHLELASPGGFSRDTSLSWVVLNDNICVQYPTLGPSFCSVVDQRINFFGPFLEEYPN